MNLPDSEPKMFERSEMFVNMVKDINQRFGFNGTLQVDDIINMYDICRNEQAWNINVGSAWCSVRNGSSKNANKIVLTNSFLSTLAVHYTSICFT